MVLTNQANMRVVTEATLIEMREIGILSNVMVGITAISNKTTKRREIDMRIPENRMFKNLTMKKRMRKKKKSLKKINSLMNNSGLFSPSNNMRRRAFQSSK